MIDCHCHVLPEEMVSDLGRFAKLDANFSCLLETKGARFVTGPDLLEEMDRIGVQGAVACGFAFRDTGVSRLQNDYVLELQRKNPGRIVALGVLSPNSPGGLHEAERCVALGMAGIGEIFPAGHGFGLDSQGAHTLAGICRDAGVPLLVHVNELLGHLYPGKGSVGPEDAYRFAKDNSKTTIVFAHLGGGLVFYYSMPEVRNLENAYYDTASQPYLYHPSVYKSLEASGAIERIVLGSDYPLLGCERYLRDLRASGISHGGIQRVIADNPRRVFGRFFLPE